MLLNFTKNPKTTRSSQDVAELMKVGETDNFPFLLQKSVENTPFSYMFCYQNFQLCLKAAAEVKKLPNTKKAPVEYLLEVFPVGVNLSNSFQLLEN